MCAGSSVTVHGGGSPGSRPSIGSQCRLFGSATPSALESVVSQGLLIVAVVATPSVRRSTATERSGPGAARGVFAEAIRRMFHVEHHPVMRARAPVDVSRETFAAATDRDSVQSSCGKTRHVGVTGSRRAIHRESATCRCPPSDRRSGAH